MKKRFQVVVSECNAYSVEVEAESEEEVEQMYDDGQFSGEDGRQTGGENYIFSIEEVKQ
jgi:hypothetical protein